MFCGNDLDKEIGYYLKAKYVRPTSLKLVPADMFRFWLAFLLFIIILIIKICGDCADDAGQGQGCGQTQGGD